MSICGGISSLVVQLYILYVALSEGIKMISNEAPYIIMTDTSLSATDKLITQERSMKDLNKLTFYF